MAFPVKLELCATSSAITPPDTLCSGTRTQSSDRRLHQREDVRRADFCQTEGSERADYISYDMEHAPFDVKGLADYMRGLAKGGPTR